MLALLKAEGIRTFRISSVGNLWTTIAREQIFLGAVPMWWPVQIYSLI